MFGFQTIKTEVKFEVTLFWSSNHNTRESRGKRKDRYPIRWPWAKDSNPIFFNFLYQIAVVVDLEKIPNGDSWIMQEMKIDNVKREDLNPSKDPVLLQRTTETAQQDSESGQINDIVSTDCEVVIKTAVEGRVELTPEERKGLNILCESRVETSEGAEVLCHVIDGQSFRLKIPQMASQSSSASSSGSARCSAVPTPLPSPEPQPGAQPEGGLPSDRTATGREFEPDDGLVRSTKRNRGRSRKCGKGGHSQSLQLGNGNITLALLHALHRTNQHRTPTHAKTFRNPHHSSA